MIGPGTSIGRYRILSRIGGGAMGDVFHAEDELLGRGVALKIARADDAADRARFLDEARHAARLAHPNLVAIFDVGVHGDTAFIAMELVNGVPLVQYLRKGACDWMVAASVGVGVSAGLAALHDGGLVHRDIKPANVMLDLGGVVKVVDFGVAVAESSADDAPMAGTPGYMAPEVVLGQPPRRAVDVFALGVLLHELVMGERLYRGATSLDRTIAVTQSVAPRLPSDRAPSWLADLVEACLVQDPAQRFAHARDVLSVLRAREPYADLAVFARRVGTLPSSIDTMGDVSIDELTEVSRPVSELVGREGVLDAMQSESRAVWIHGPPGRGKTSLAAERMMRVANGNVLSVEAASGRAALAGALGLKSAADESAMSDALRDLAPVLVVLDDVPDARVGLDLLACVHADVPDARVVILSEEPAPPRDDVVGIALAPLSDALAERFLLDRVAHVQAALARTLAPLTAGSPLCLDLLARALADATWVETRGGDLLHTLLERVLLSLPPAMRRITELLAVGTERAVILLRLGPDAALLGETLVRLEQAGVLERREPGPTLHRAFRAIVVERTQRDGQEALRRAELADRLAAALDVLGDDRDDAELPARVASLVALHHEIADQARRAIASGGLDALARASELLVRVVDPSRPYFDGALVLADGVTRALERSGAPAETLACAHLVRAWAHDDDLPSSIADADRALALGTTRWTIPALAVRASVLKRQGHDAEARDIFVVIARDAVAAGHPAYARLATWEIPVGDLRTGDDGPARRIVASDPIERIPGLLGPRIMVLRTLMAIEVRDLPRAVRSAQHTVDAARRLGQSRFAGFALLYLLELHLLMGEPELAEAAGRQGWMLGRGARLPFLVSHISGHMALVRLVRGRAEEAVRLAAEGRVGVVRATTHRLQHALAYVREGLCRGIARADGAEACLEAAREAAHELPSYAEVLGRYADLAHAGLGDADAIARIDEWIAQPPAAGAIGEVALVHALARALRPRLHAARTTWVGHE